MKINDQHKMRLTGLGQDRKKTHGQTMTMYKLYAVDLVFNSLPRLSNLRRRFDANTKDIYRTHGLAIPDPASPYALTTPEYCNQFSSKEV